MDNVIYMDQRLHNATVNLKTGGGARVNVESEAGITVRPKIIRQIVPPAEGSISAGQRAEFQEKIKEWVKVSNTAGKPVAWGEAWSRLFRKAKSAGKKGVTRIADFPACDFEEGMKYLRMEIGKLSKSSRYIQNDPETARRKMLAVIHHKKKANKVGDVAYREYLLAEFGATSSAGLDMASLMRFRDYMQGGGKCILPRPKEKSLQERRVDSLVRLMQLRGGEPFSSLDNAQVALIEHDRGLFDGLGLDAFRKFWGRQKVTKLKRGRKASSQEVPLKRG